MLFYDVATKYDFLFKEDFFFYNSTHSFEGLFGHYGDDVYIITDIVMMFSCNIVFLYCLCSLKPPLIHEIHRFSDASMSATISTIMQ